VAAEPPRAAPGAETAHALLSGRTEEVQAAVDRLVAVLSRGDSEPGARAFRRELEGAFLRAAADRESLLDVLAATAREGAPQAEWARRVAQSAGPGWASGLSRRTDPGRGRVRHFDVGDLVSDARSVESLRALVAAEAGAGSVVEAKRRILVVRADPERLDAVEAKLAALRGRR
jgi:hypothetical protein